MFFPFLLLLAAAAFGARRADMRRTSTALSILTVLIFFFAGCGLMPKILLRGLQYSKQQLHPEWKQRNAIVVLGAGLSYWPWVGPDASIVGHSRLFEAARLYNACRKARKSCTIIVSGGDPEHYGVAEAKIMERCLTDIGVAHADIVTEGKSSNTFQNAYYAGEILKAKPVDQVLVVTSGVHMVRAMMYFAYWNIPALPAPADRLGAIPAIWPTAYNFMLTDQALHEYVGTLRFKIFPSSYKI